VNEQLRIYSPLPPDECARRISAAIDPERSSFFSRVGSRPIVGRVDSSSIRLRKRINYGNSFQTFLTATVRAHDAGTVIQGEFAMHPLTRIFMPVWFGGVLFVGGASYMISVFSKVTHPSPHQEASWPLLLISAGMLVCGYLVLQFGRYLARYEAAFITEFLRSTLDSTGKSRNA